jgi:hypothetical protein
MFEDLDLFDSTTVSTDSIESLSLSPWDNSPLDDKIWNSRDILIIDCGPADIAYRHVLAIRMTAPQARIPQELHFPHPPVTPNDWTLDLVLNESDRLKISMLPGDGTDGRRGFMLLEYHAQQKRPDPAVHSRIVCQIAVQSDDFAPFTVQNLLGVLVDHAHERYWFDHQNRGWRYWIFTAIQLWEKEDIVARGTSEQAYNTLSNIYIAAKDQDGRTNYDIRFPLMMLPGTFY